MKNLKRVLLALVAALFVCAMNLSTPVAQAAYGDEFTRFDVDATVDSSGVFAVTMTVDLKFATTGHGPYLWFLTRQTYDESHDRLYKYGNFVVYSPTNAPTDLDLTKERNDVQLRIGDPDQLISGTQTYVVTYTVSGIVNPDVTSSNMDEIYWNVIGTNWDLPISNVTVTLHSPAAVSRTTCYMGADFSSLCTANTSSGATATYSQDSLLPGEGLAVVGGWPVGTFPGAKINLVSSSQNPFGLADGGGYWAGGAALATGLSAWLLARLRKKGRDEQYANVTPGMVPAQGDKVETRREEVLDAAVEFAPPKGIPPRLVGACAREGTDNVDITATIIDLAVRGYIHMNQREGDDFDFTRTNASPDSLNHVDRYIYDKLFETSPTITKQEMSSASFYETYSTFQSVLKKEFDNQHWYKSNPKAVVTSYRIGGILIAIVGLVISIVAGSALATAGILGFAWLLVPCLVLGIGMVVVAPRMPVRTPVGSAVAIQSLGFKKYLETAEASQIRWEEGQDIFSQYLPYAISFGCADRWSTIVQELVAKGAPVPQPTWYTGYYPYSYPAWGLIANSVNNIGNSFSSSVTAHAAQQAVASGGSSGGSGFGGGGFGGGVGGGGGGSW